MKWTVQLKRCWCRICKIAMYLWWAFKFNQIKWLKSVIQSKLSSCRWLVGISLLQYFVAGHRRVWIVSCIKALSPPVNVESCKTYSGRSSLSSAVCGSAAPLTTIWFWGLESLTFQAQANFRKPHTCQTNLLNKHLILRPCNRQNFSQMLSNEKKSHKQASHMWHTHMPNTSSISRQMYVQCMHTRRVL